MNGCIIEEGDFCFSLRKNVSTDSINIVARPKNSNGVWQPAAEVSAKEACITRVHGGWMNSPELFPVVSAVCSACSRLAA